MRIFVLGSIAFVLVATPVYMLNTMVMPQMQAMLHTYQAAEQTAQAAADIGGR